MTSTVTDISDNAFYGTGLTSLVIPSTVTRIGTQAFANCTALTNIVLERYGTLGYTTLGLNCFNGTTGINYQNFASIHDMYVNGYGNNLGDVFRSGPYRDYSDPSALTITYYGAGFDNSAVDYAITGACFNEGSKILCLNPISNEEEYVLVQNLKKGDIVKTYLHGYRKVDVICTGKLRNNLHFFGRYMCKMRKTETNDLIEDLIVTGAHSLLVDKLSEEEYVQTIDIFSKKWKIPFKIDDKYLLLAGISDKFEIMTEDFVYTYYHFCLENDGNNEARYGVWANGILVETPCKKNILNFRNVLYI